MAQRRGYEIVHPLTTEPWGVRRFFVRAPDGNVMNELGDELADMVVVTSGRDAHRRQQDGVAVVPLALLGP